MTGRIKQEHQNDPQRAAELRCKCQNEKDHRYSAVRRKQTSDESGYEYTDESAAFCRCMDMYMRYDMYDLPRLQSHKYH